MDFIKDFFTNHIILAAASAWLLSQLIKTVVNIIVYRKFTFERFFGDGGMPSGHSATVTALMIMVGWVEGFNTAVFAISAVLALVVMHDAVGVRRETGKQAVSIKELANTINKAFLSDNTEIKTENLKVLVGHTPLQVVFGAILGACVSVGYILIFLV